MRDLRYALRALRASPWYSVTVTLVLSIGMALATVVFAVVDGVLFKPPPYPRPTELYVVKATTIQSQPVTVSYREIDAWRAAVPEIAVTGLTASVGRLKQGADRAYHSAYVDERFFDVVGVKPLVGGFSAADFDWFQPKRGSGVIPVVVSYRYWQRELGGDVNAVGRIDDAAVRGTLRVGHRIAGILPPDFVFPFDGEEAEPEMLVPAPRLWRQREDYHALIRVPPGVGPSSIGQRLLGGARAAAAAAPPSEYPSQTPASQLESIEIVSAVKELGSRERPAFMLILCAAGVLLLLACVNVAGLAAARNLERQRDVAIRRALGAGTTVIARSLLMEIGALAAIAASLALLLARPMLVGTIALLPPTVTLLKIPEIDGRVFSAVVVVLVVTIAAIALLPLRVAARANAAALTGPQRTGVNPRERAFLVVSVQVALGFVLLTAGGLTFKSIANAWLNDTGYHREQMLLLEAYISNYTSGANATEQLGRIEKELGRIPGVAAVATSSIQPLFSSSTQRAWTALIPRGWKQAPPGASMRRVSATFFDVLGLRLVDGRWPAAGEWAVRSQVAIVSETAARTFWPGRSAVGEILVPERPGVGGERFERRVIGVVADARYSALDQNPIADIYVPDQFEPGRTGAFFHVRTSEPAAAVLPRVVATLRQWVNLTQALTHEDALFASVKHRALPAWLFGSLGIAAVVLAGTGILGLLAMTSARRTREIGIRIALGATSWRVMRLLLREQLGAVAAGLAAGALVSVWAARLAESQLYRVQPYDPGVWTLVALTVIAVATVGALIPSARVARSNPADVLRTD